MALAVAALGSVSAAPVFAQGTPELPRYQLDTDTFPTVTGQSRFVTAAQNNLQATLNAALPGDEVVLQAGDTFLGTYTLPVKCGATSWIVVRTSNMAGIPPVGTRVDPAVHASAMPKILTNNTNMPAITTQPYTGGCFAQHYWLVGLEISVASGITDDGDLVELGDIFEADPSHQAQYLYIDRSYIHGSPSQGPGGRNTPHGVRMDAKWLAVVNSYLKDFQGADGRQAQAIGGVSGPGPYKITNNYLEGAAENLMFGGGDPTTCHGPAGCTVPSDITITNNTMRKPLYWKRNDPSWVTGTPNWCIGNLLELKNAQRVLIDHNDMQYSWWTGCDGNLSNFSIALTVRDQDGSDPAAVVQDVTFTNNYIAHVPGGINFLGQDDGYPSQPETRILVRNNVFDDVSTAWTDGVWGPAGGRMFQILLPGPPNGTGVPAPDYLTIDHNTLVNNDANDNSYISIGTAVKMAHFVFTNNIVGEAVYGVKGDGSGIDSLSGAQSAFKMYFDSTLVFTNNVIVGVNESNYTHADGLVGNVSNNFFPGPWSNVGFVNFNNGSGGDYHLSASSPYRNVGTGGSAAGADIDQVGPGPTLPSPWVSQDIGAVGLAGSASYSSGTFTVRGAGADVWASSDSFRFVYQPLNGDGTIITRVTAIQNTNPSAKAGVMLRETLNANSAHVILNVNPNGNIEFMTRPTAGANTTYLAGATQAPPTWLKLTRIGSVVTGYVSANGTSWTQVGTTTLSIASSAYIGFLVCSHDTTQLNTSTFDNVSVSGPSTSNIVIYASDIPTSTLHGNWSQASDSTSPNSIKLTSVDAGWSTIDTPLAAPTDYFDVTFVAPANTPYRLWLRTQATANSKWNDSLWVQFSDAQSGGSSIYPINTTSGLLVNLATDSTGSSLNAWGWDDTAYWLSQTTTFTFPTSGTHTMRIQIREDGVQLDQIVLSPTQYLNQAPGGPTNDSTIVPKP